MRSTLVEKIFQLSKSATPYGVALQIVRRAAVDNGSLSFLIGGTCRDLLLGETPRDLDIVTWGADWAGLEKALSPYLIRTNRFGGMKLRIEGADVDIWPAENTATFKNEGAILNSIAHVPKTTSMTLESILVEIPDVTIRTDAMPYEEAFEAMLGISAITNGIRRQSELLVFEDGFFDAIQKKLVEIQNPENSAPALLVVRLKKTAEKLKKHGFKLGPKALAYIEQNRFPEDELEAVRKAHYTA